MIINNGAAQTTGGQPIGKDMLSKTLKMFEGHILEINDPYNPVEAAEKFEIACKTKNMQLVIANFRK